MINDLARAIWRWTEKKDAQDDVTELFDMFDAHFWGWKGIWNLDSQRRSSPVFHRLSFRRLSLAESGASSKIETGNTSEVWTEAGEAEMQALLARRNRISIVMIGDSRVDGSMMHPSGAVSPKKRRVTVQSGYWSMILKLRDHQNLRSRRRIFSFPKGVKSVEKWGRVLTAWKKEKLTFAKTLSMSEHNEKTRKYFNFVLAKFGE